ncbi:hypothetical protein [Anoxybacteroides tepidamans]|uniref:hypothetical protein n=1 Tax=Anoxybacteroides tepidamans TaxID=265948 RepID=UPI0006866F00|nr:hypothetical protein [Anoxybacillus tepidamans]
MGKSTIWLGRFMAVVTVLFLAAVFLPSQTKAASIQPVVEKLERNAKQLDQKIRSTAFEKPYSLFNETKKSYSAAKKEVGRLKDGPTKRQYTKRIDAAYLTIQKASYYISAIESGEKLLTLKSRIDRALSAGDVDTLYDVYPSFANQLKKASALIQKASYPSVRQKMVEKFQHPAESTKQRAFYPMNIMLAFDRIIDAYDNDDVEEAERLLALCDQWLANVKDAKTKKELSLYLEDFKAPVIIDVE